MKLEQLRPNLCELPPEKAFVLFEEYYNQRIEDLRKASEAPPPKTRKAGSGRKRTKDKSAVTVTVTQFETLKKLGLI